VEYRILLHGAGVRVIIKGRKPSHLISEIYPGKGSSQERRFFGG
jgi:hypothetical protein